MSKIAAFALALALATSAAARGAGMRFDVPEPFRIAGHRYDPGSVSVRSVGVSSQSRSLVEVWVGGSCLGAFAATRSPHDVASLRDEALFRRDDEGGLVMVGFRVAGDRAGEFRFVTELPTLAEARTPTSRR